MGIPSWHVIITTTKNIQLNLSFFSYLLVKIVKDINQKPEEIVLLDDMKVVISLKNSLLKSLYLIGGRKNNVVELGGFACKK